MLPSARAKRAGLLKRTSALGFEQNEPTKKRDRQWLNGDCCYPAVSASRLEKFARFYGKVGQMSNACRCFAKEKRLMAFYPVTMLPLIFLIHPFFHPFFHPKG
jgi:hypothetical protein